MSILKSTNTGSYFSLTPNKIEQFGFKRANEHNFFKDNFQIYLENEIAEITQLVPGKLKCEFTKLNNAIDLENYLKDKSKIK